MLQVFSVPTFPTYLGREVPAEPASLLAGVCSLAEEHQATSHGLQPLTKESLLPKKLLS